MTATQYLGITADQALVLIGEFTNEADARQAAEIQDYDLVALFNEDGATDLLRRLHEFLKLEPTIDGMEWYVAVDWTGKPWLLDEFPSWNHATRAVADMAYGDCVALLGRQQQWAWRRMLLAVLDMAVMSPELIGEGIAPPKRGRKGKKGPKQPSLH